MAATRIIRYAVVGLGHIAQVAVIPAFAHSDLHADPAYEYAEGLEFRLTVDGKSTRKKIGKRDQFAPELD